MDFEPTEYVRKSFNVKAEEVTYENIEAVAEWCKGRVDSESTKILGGNEVKLPVVILAGQGEDKGKEIVARLGYFVVYSKGRFRVYKAPQFHASFEKQVVLQQVAGQPYEPEVDDEIRETLDREVEEKNEAVSA